MMTGTRTVRDEAHYYASRGWHVIPIRPGEKRPAIDAWVEHATTDHQLIDEWWTAHPNHGVGIVTGERSGIFALDVDPQHGGDDTLADLEHEHGQLPDTIETITGSGGRHVLFAWPGWNPGTNAQALGPGLDIRADGGQIVAPPTIHPNGRAYCWETAHDPHDGLGPTAAPEWFLALLQPVSAPVPRREIVPYKGEPRPGDRFAASVTWPELLESDGAHCVARRVDRQTGHPYELWVRPGKNARDGASASLYYAGTDLLKVFSTNWPGLVAGETYSRFGYLAATRYRGDHNAAARALADIDNEKVSAWIAGLPTDERAVAATTDDDDGLDESWQRVDLGPALRGEVTAVTPTILARDDHQRLLYAGRVNGIHGDSGDGKTWVADIACAQELAAGNHVIWIDFEDNELVLTERLRILDVPTDTIDERCHYHRPTAPFDDHAVAHIAAETTTCAATLVVIDSLGEAFGIEGVDEDRDREVGPWLRRVARRLADTGAAILLIDHSTKAKDNPLFPSGSKRKRAAITGASYLLDAVSPLTRERGGRLRLICAKDRHGTYRRGDPAAIVDFAIYPDGGWSIKVWPPRATSDAPDEKLRTIARAAIRAAKRAGRPMTGRELRELMNVRASHELKLAAIDYAIQETALKVTEGPRRAVLHEYVRDLPDPTETTNDDRS